jgi:hypothetical protein
MTDHRPAVEQMIRDLIADQPNLPIRANFYRGATGRTGPFDEWTRYEHAETPGCPQEWFVMVRPSALEILVQAAGRFEWGTNDIIGTGIEIGLPQTVPGVVDVEALDGSALHVQLLAAIRSKAAVVADMAAAIRS